MKCFPLLPCYGGPVVEVKRCEKTFAPMIVYMFATGERRSVIIDDNQIGEYPEPGDIVIIHGPTVSWMTPDEFAEHYEEIPNVAAQ